MRKNSLFSSLAVKRWLVPKSTSANWKNAAIGIAFKLKCWVGLVDDRPFVALHISIAPATYTIYNDKRVAIPFLHTIHAA